MGGLGSPPTVTEELDPTLSDMFLMFDLLDLGSSYSVSKGGWWDFSSRATWTPWITWLSAGLGYKGDVACPRLKGLYFGKVVGGA